jgi:acetyl-CoA carboxylase carboxyl transferase subunit alpha
VATANTVLMLEHAIYSVISPEGAASILWRDAARARDAAAALKITAQDLKKLGVIDEIIPEPLGGAHRVPDQAIQAAGEAIARALGAYAGVSGDVLRTQRREKFLGIGRNI